jgi:transposase
MMKITTVGLDLAKSVFTLHAVDEHGNAVLRKTVRRGKLLDLFAQLPACVVGMEACSGAQHWARELRKLGLDPRIMAAVFVEPYRHGGKNDANDAAAICEAVSRPKMRSVTPTRSPASHAKYSPMRTNNCRNSMLASPPTIGVSQHLRGPACRQSG